MKNLNSNEKVALLEHLGTIYRKEIINAVSLALQVEEDEPIYIRHELHVEIDRIISRIPYKYAQIIKNDFLRPKEKNWWKEYYTKKTYEHMKNIAMSTFFHCLYT